MAGPPDFKTILVLDDDPDFHKLVVPVLTSRGHKVLSAHRGEEACQIMLGESHVDLVVVDGQLPDMTGIDWISNLRAGGSKTLVMFVSAFWRDGQSYHKLTGELGVSLVLHKPVLTSVFAAEVDILLGKLPGFGAAAHVDVEDTLLLFRADYARELPAKLAELQGLIAQVIGQPENRYLLGEARAHAHKLRGTASSYGFQQLGQLAARVEDDIVNILNERQSAPLWQIKSAVELMVQLGQAAALDVEPNQAAAKGSENQTAELKGGAAVACILVVDDDAAFLDLVGDLARQHQMEVVRAASAFQALEMACMQAVDAALIDVELGSHDAAFKLAGDLRMLPGYEDLPLGFISGSGHIEKLTADQAGQFLVFNRPKEAQALQAAIRQLTAIKQASSPKVLIIDDDKDFLERTAFVLRHEGMQVETLISTGDILDELGRLSPDMLLLDVMMPGVGGFDICRMLRSMPRYRDLPILLLTAYADIDTRVASMKCGADDCLTKPVVNEELSACLQMRLERARLLKQRLEHDNVSGLLSRRSFMQHFSGMLSEAKRQGWTAAVCLLELSAVDLADTHVTFDSLLMSLGNLIERRLRTEDLKGRWDGRRLILAFRNEQLSAIDQTMRRLVDEFLLAQQPDIDERLSKTRLDYALSCYPSDGNSIHQLMDSAHAKLRQALTAGKPA